jgi:hypothetical protein
VSGDVHTHGVVAHRLQNAETGPLGRGRGEAELIELCLRIGCGGEISRAARTFPPGLPPGQRMRLRAKVEALQHLAILALERKSRRALDGYTSSQDTCDTQQPSRKTAGKPKAAPAVQKLAATKAVNKERTATSAPEPASMIGPLPPIVTLKHLAERAGYNHGVPKKQAIEMFTGFVGKGQQNPLTRPRARRSRSKPVKRQRRLHSEPQRFERSNLICSSRR